MYEHYFKSFIADTKSRLRKSSAPLVGFSGEIYHPLGLIDLRVTMGEPGKKKSVLLEFAIVRYRSPNNVILGNTMASAHGIDVKSKRTDYIEEPEHLWSKARKGSYGLQRFLGRRYSEIKSGTTPGKYAWITRALTKSAKDIYPFLEVEEKLGSLIGYQYKCFLRLPKEDSHVRMSENDEEKMGFHTEEGVYCFTHKPAKKFWSYSSKGNG
ncbi:hypothetical protein Tco_1306919 [Tanacetum coccineum]